MYFLSFKKKNFILFFPFHLIQNYFLFSFIHLGHCFCDRRTLNRNKKDQVIDEAYSVTLFAFSKAPAALSTDQQIAIGFIL